MHHRQLTILFDAPNSRPMGYRVYSCTILSWVRDPSTGRTGRRPTARASVLRHRQCDHCERTETRIGAYSHGM